MPIGADCIDQAVLVEAGDRLAAAEEANVLAGSRELPAQLRGQLADIAGERFDTLGRVLERAVGLNDAPARGLHRVLVGDRPVPGRPITIAPMLPKKAWKSISGVK